MTLNTAQLHSTHGMETFERGREIKKGGNYMKVEELSIGDWMCSTFSDKPCMVTAIELHESGYSSVMVNGVEGRKDIASLIPIPITPEILEKNGFEEFDGWMVDEHEGSEIGWMGTILKGGGEIGNFEFPVIMYVHQFQHVLRLVGIEKQIIL